MVTGFFFSQFKTNYKWGYRIFGRHGNLCTNENAWRKTKHGDLAAYSVFLKEHLFVEADPGQVLVVPDRHKTKVPFARKFWLGVPPLYLFPTRIEIADNYKFEITEKEMNKLKALEMRTSSYGNRRYHLLTALNITDYSKWAMYIHKTGKKVDIFTLPFDYTKKLNEL